MRPKRILSNPTKLRRSRLVESVWGRVIALAGLVLVAGLPAAADEMSAPVPAPFPAHYVTASSVFAPWGLRPEAAMTPEGDQTFGNAWQRIALRHDSREIDLDGRRVFMSEGVIAHRGQLWLSQRDVESLLHPVLRPQDFSTEAKIVKRIWLDAGHGGKIGRAHV